MAVSRGLYSRCRLGFTLAEVVIALTVFTVGILGLSAAVGVVASRLNASLLQTRVTTSAQARLESLLARRLEAPASDQRRVGETEISWWVGGDDPMEIRVIATGWLAGSQATDSLTTLARQR